MVSALQDLRYGLRLLMRSPGFSLIAIAALAIGIGANTAIFSVINTLLLQRLPYRDADRLAIIWEHNLPRDRKSNVSSKWRWPWSSSSVPDYCCAASCAC